MSGWSLKLVRGRSTAHSMPLVFKMKEGNMAITDDQTTVRQQTATEVRSEASPSPEEESGNYKARSQSDAQETFALLCEIRDLLSARLPEPLQKKPWWRPRKWFVWTAFLMIALFFLDLPTESQRNADLVVLEGTELSIVKMPEPDWDAVGVRPSAEYWRLPKLEPNARVDTLWEFSLYRQGRRYKQSGIRVVQSNGETLVDLLSPPVRVDGPTRIVINPISEFQDDRKLMGNRIVRIHALKAGNRIVPLHRLIDPSDQSGSFTLEAKPKVGWERFKSNLSLAFGLLK